ncbi:unnamed protein product [Adineta steineri]|uniref:G-protein coupled receptors family 1 profile domain-containing protein n=1 Tax=Adineta steineri TaxID=433720 RepID=A0A814XIB5_9BILA|nr:unnamed protein product [Adineta steineri]CAF1211547.1 unnamed protein product [Adineta steineri]CAF3650566.1 unnamed protein product [Adineta steineri]CAF3669571.1 unnamed protein product [Adineta steineri]
MVRVIDAICIILFVLGFIGNLLGLVVFSSRRFRCCSTYATLALTSFAVNLICIVRYSLLLHSATRLWLTDNIIHIHWLACKFFRLSSSSRVIAAWVTVFWVIERFIYVSSRLNVLFHRHGRYRIFEKYKYVYMICILLFIVMIVSGPITIFYAPYPISLNRTDSSTKCTYNPSHTSPAWESYFTKSSFSFNHTTIRFLLSEIIPSVLVGLFNIGIIICILRTTAHVRRRQEYQHNNQLSLSTVTGTTSKVPSSNAYDANQQQQQQRRGSIRRCSFKNTTTPASNVPFGKMSWMNIVLILHSLLFFFSFSATSLVYFSTSDAQLAYWTSIIILASCSLNFYVYCLSGKHFRRELKRIAKRYLRNLYKKILRHCYKDDNRRHSTAQNIKDQIYRDVLLRDDFADLQLRQYQMIERMK